MKQALLVEVFPVNIFPGGKQPARQLNPQLLIATLLVQAVQRDVASLVPLALREGTVTVSETRIERWQAALQGAVTLIGQVPAVLIFPPPAFVTFANGAVQQINQALTTIVNITIASTRPFPQQAGLVPIPLETLQFILTDLQQAETLLIQALQAA